MPIKCECLPSEAVKGSLTSIPGEGDVMLVKRGTKLISIITFKHQPPTGPLYPLKVSLALAQNLDIDTCAKARNRLGEFNIDLVLHGGEINLATNYLGISLGFLLFIV